MSRAVPRGDIQRMALQWQVTLWSGEVSAQERHAFDAWLGASAEHRAAWQRVQRIDAQLGGVADGVASRVLRASPAAIDRRKLLLSLGLCAGAGLAGYGVTTTTPWRSSIADYRTATGERRDVTLPDATQLSLNTATAVDVHFSASERRIRLLRGEILIATAPDTAAVPRPFVVETAAGEIRPIGTLFVVREIDDERIRLQVQQGAVQLFPDAGKSHRLDAGQQTEFDRHRIDATRELGQYDGSWSRGLLVAERRRLGDFIAELDRYRRGILRCDPQVAELVLSGVYPLHDTDAILHSLAQALPVRIASMTRYVVTVTAR